MVALLLMPGDEEAVRRRLADVAPKIPADLPMTSKLGFPEILNPGEVRNDFYVHLLRGK